MGRRAVTGALAVSGAVVVSFAVVGVLAAAQDDAPEVGLTTERAAACAREILTGRVTDVDDGPADVDDGYTSVGLDVAAWLKPASGDDVLTVDVPTDPGGHVRVSEGDRVLVVVYPGDTLGVELTVGGRREERTREMRRALAAPDPVACPTWAR